MKYVLNEYQEKKNTFGEIDFNFFNYHTFFYEQMYFKQKLTEESLTNFQRERHAK